MCIVGRSRAWGGDYGIIGRLTHLDVLEAIQDMKTGNPTPLHAPVVLAGLCYLRL